MLNMIHCRDWPYIQADISFINTIFTIITGQSLIRAYLGNFPSFDSIAQNG